MRSLRCNHSYVCLWHDAMVKLFWIKNVILFIECFFSICSLEKNTFFNWRKYRWENKVRERMILFCWEIIMFWLLRAGKARPYQITHFKHSCTKCYFKINLTCLRSSFFQSIYWLCIKNMRLFIFAIDNCNYVRDGNGESKKNVKR